MNGTATVAHAALSSAIFLVEDEPVLRSSLARGLSRLTNVEVLTAGTVDEAVLFLGTRVPSLLISDIDLPGASGLDLVAEFSRREIDVPIILVTAYLNIYRDQIPARPNMLVLEKPIPLEDLRARVKQLLGTGTGALQPPFNLVDCVQLACTNRRSARIDMDLSTGPAQVVIHEGEVWSAEDDQGSGPSAFQRLAFVPDTLIHYGFLVGEPGPRNITTRWERLVLDLANAPDESQPVRANDALPTAGAQPPPSESPRPAAHRPAVPPFASSHVGVSPPLSCASSAPSSRPRSPTLPGMPQVPPEAMRECAAAPTFDELWALGIEASLKRQYVAAARAFRAAGELRQGHPGVLANLRRLKEMGYGQAGENGEFN